MGSPISSIMANIYIESLEMEALSTSPHAPDSSAGMWMTYLA